MAKTFTIGVYDDDTTLLAAVERLRHDGHRIHEVYTPFPVHGLEHALGYQRSRLPKVAFWMGALGLASAVSMQVWMMGIDWQMDVGGKPHIPWPSFVPVSFELTVLFAALGMVGAYLISSKMGPGAKVTLADLRQTDDRFVVLMQTPADDASRQRQLSAYQNSGAVDVRVADLDL